MKILVVMVFLAFLFVLNVGYYKFLGENEDEDDVVFFIKRSPTLRMEFFNIYATDGDLQVVKKPAEDLRKDVIDYCKYRWGIETELETQEDVEVCAKM